MIEASKTIDMSLHPRRHGGQAASPFRYPGGKGFLTPFLASELTHRFQTTKPHFAEPYCGGAGAALNLLVEEKVDFLHLNDADIRIFSAWYAIVNETNRFIDAIFENTATIKNWERFLRILHDTSHTEYNFDVGFAAFFINRTSRSGVLLGSGPIGGYNQDGKWKIDARYYKDALANRVERIGKYRSSIEVSRMDGLEFCKSLRSRNVLDRTFLFIDPPYVKAGSRLYHDGMNSSKHNSLAAWLVAGNAPHWLLTYDDHPIVRENYAAMQDFRLDVRYSLARRRMEGELLYMS